MPENNQFLTCAAQPSAEQAAVDRAPYGLSDNPMPGPWRVIIARTPDRYVTYYYHQNDDRRLKLALHRQAERWLAAQNMGRHF